MSDGWLRGWRKCEYGAFYKEIGQYRFRLHRGQGWRISIEYIDPPRADKLNGAKELVHLIARGMDL